MHFVQSKFFPSKAYPWAAASVCLLLFVFILSLLRNPVSLDDGLRHIMMGKRMAQDGIFAVPGWSSWLSSGYFHDHRLDPWFLSDVLYVPLAGMETVMALKLFSLESALLLALCFGLCLRQMKVRASLAALLLTLLLLGHGTFTFRLLIGRPFVVLTACMLLLICSILQRRPILAGLLMLIVALLSHLFVFAVGISIVGFLWLWIGRQRRDALQLLGTSVAGTVTGILLHPAPLEYLQYLWLFFIQIPFKELPDRGGELFGGFGEGTILYPFVGFAILLIAVLIRERTLQWKNPIVFLSTLTGLFLVQFFLWVRSIDLLWPLLLLLIGALITEQDGMALRQLAALLSLSKRKRRAAGILCLLCLFSTVLLARALIKSDSTRSLEPYAQALSAARPGERILNVDWDRFPALVTVRPDLQYSLGIDPMFSAASNSGAYALTRMLQKTEGLTDTRQYIDAKAVLTSLNRVHHADFALLSRARMEPIITSLEIHGLRNVSGNEEWALFRIK